MATETSCLKELAYPEYWNDRYELEQKNIAEASNGPLPSYDWFRAFDKIRPVLLKHLPPASDNVRILHLGCGNSVRLCQESEPAELINIASSQTLTSDLYQLHYHSQISIDFSSVVIQAMNAKYAELGTQWHVMDVRKLQFPDFYFDIAIDKVNIVIESSAIYY